MSNKCLYVARFHGNFDLFKIGFSTYPCERVTEFRRVYDCNIDIEHEIEVDDWYRGRERFAHKLLDEFIYSYPIICNLGAKNPGIEMFSCTIDAAVSAVNNAASIDGGVMSKILGVRKLRRLPKILNHDIRADDPRIFVAQKPDNRVLMVTGLGVAEAEFLIGHSLNKRMNYVFYDGKVRLGRDHRITPDKYIKV